MGHEASPTTFLLAKIGEQDAAALDALLRRLMPRVERWVHQRRGALLRSADETVDNTQDVLIELARYLPRVRIGDSRALDGLLLRMIRNTLANRSDYLTARRRSLTREQPLDPLLELELDPRDERSPSPSMVMMAQEREARLRFALALLDPEDQELLMRRHYDSEDYERMADRLGLTADATRMRCKRAEVRLGITMRKLDQGQVAALGAEGDEDAGPVD